MTESEFFKEMVWLLKVSLTVIMALWILETAILYFSMRNQRRLLDELGSDEEVD